MLAIFDLCMIYVFLATWMIEILCEDPFFFKRTYTIDKASGILWVRTSEWAVRIRFLAGIVLAIRIADFIIRWLIGSHANLATFTIYTSSLTCIGLLILFVGFLAIKCIAYLDKRLGNQYGPEEEVEKHEVQQAVPRLRQAVQ